MNRRRIHTNDLRPNERWKIYLGELLSNHPGITVDAFGNYHCCCGKSKQCFSKIKNHIIKQHLSNNVIREILMGSSINNIISTPLTSLFQGTIVPDTSQQEQRQQEREQQQTQERQLNVQYPTLVIQKENFNKYSSNYIINFIRFISTTGTPISSVPGLFKEFQLTIMKEGEIDLPTPCESTLRRHLLAVERTLPSIFDDIINNNNNNNFSRLFDESDGYLSIYYGYSKILSSQEIENLQRRHTFLVNQQFKTIEQKQELVQLARKLKFKYERRTLCYEVTKIKNLTTLELKTKIENAERNFNRKPSFSVSDHGSSTLSFLKQDTSHLLNCMGHVLNLTYKHFSVALSHKFNNTIARIIRKLRSSWASLKYLISMLNNNPNFIEYLEQYDDIILEEDFANDFTFVNKPSEAVITRWKTTSESAEFIYNNLENIKKAVQYWKVDRREENIQITWAELLDLLEDPLLLECLQYNHIFYKEFLGVTFQQLRTHNTIDYLFEYVTSWTNILNQLTVASDNNGIFRKAKIAAITEFKKLTGHHLENPITFLASLANEQYARDATIELRRYYQRHGRFDTHRFSGATLNRIYNGGSLFENPNDIANWVKEFGCAVLDNELVEGGFSKFNKKVMVNRENKDGIMKLIENNPYDWYDTILTTKYQLYTENLQQVNNEDRLKKLSTHQLQKTLLSLREERNRRIQFERSFFGEDIIDAVIYLIRVFNAQRRLHNHSEITFSVRYISKNNLLNILEYLIENNYIDDDEFDLDSALTISELIHIFNRSLVVQAARAFIQDNLQFIIRNTSDQTKQKIVDLCSVLGVSLDNISTSSTQSTSTHMDDDDLSAPVVHIVYKPTFKSIRNHTQDNTQDI